MGLVIVPSIGTEGPRKNKKSVADCQSSFCFPLSETAPLSESEMIRVISLDTGPASWKGRGVPVNGPRQNELTNRKEGRVYLDAVWEVPALLPR